MTKNIKKKRESFRRLPTKARGEEIPFLKRDFSASPRNDTKQLGKVFLVGAGPGDPGLITVKGLEILQQADAVVYDALVNPSLLQMPKTALKIDAGKRHVTKCYPEPNKLGERSKTGILRPQVSLAQDDINKLLVRLARQGKRVVRLKGGDPFIFGRGGEELDALKKAGIVFEVVPGVSAGHAVPAYAGIPVTDRRLASQVTFVTGHEDPAKLSSSVDWKALAKSPGTLVFFMGVKNLKRVCRRLIREGCDPEKPAAVIEWGTLPQQKVAEGSLSRIASKAARARLAPPALMVVGEVARLRKKLNWFKPAKSSRKLSGKTVVITRPRMQASSLKNLLEQEGAEVLEFPAIEILPPQSWAALDRAVQNIRNFDWIIFTSTHGVRSLMERLQKSKHDVRALSQVRLAAIGEATQGMLKNFGLKADFVPSRFTSENLVKELDARHPVRGLKFLLPRTDIAPEKLRRDLEARGACVIQVIAYRTVPGAGASPEARHKKVLQEQMRRKKMDYITFTSASTVRNFFESVSSRQRQQLKKSRAKMVSIGPVTTETLKDYGFKPYREAKRHTVQGLVEALLHG